MIVLIAAVARNGVIGVAGGLPWSLPADLRRFKRLTVGQTVVMGRATFESIGRPLPDRVNIVLTRNPDFSAHDVEVAHSVGEALTIAGHGGPESGELFVIGGAAVYEQFLELADRMELTMVDAAPFGDVWFPAWQPEKWHQVASEKHEGPPPFEFRTLERAVAPPERSTGVLQDVRNRMA
ncbi:MAG: dihydrofolate reductase [Acidimicrobiia bacterium]|nr:dihydrofolate reductase [Acidimicrobiia bacterium]